MVVGGFFLDAPPIFLGWKASAVFGRRDGFSGPATAAEEGNGSHQGDQPGKSSPHCGTPTVITASGSLAASCAEIAWR